MKILLIEPLGDGGIAHYTYNLANALVQNQVNTNLVTASKYELLDKSCQFKIYPEMFHWAFRLIKRFPELDRETGISNIVRRVIKINEYPNIIYSIIRIAQAHRIPLIHIQSVNEIDLVMIILLKLLGFKVIFTIHNVFPRHGDLNFYHTVIYRFMYSLCNRLIIHTTSGKEIVMKLFRVKSEKIKVIPHGDYQFFKSGTPCNKDQARKILGIDPGKKVMLFFGAIRANKGLDYLLQAIPAIRSKIPEIQLIIAGEICEDYSRYLQIINQHHLMNQVIEKLYYIPHEEVEIFFTASDLVVLPYREVTGSGVLQIAYAFGRPVIASRLEGFEEVIEEGKNGYLVPAGDYSALAEKIIQVFQENGRLEEMGQHSEMLSYNKYSWNSCAIQTLEVYQDILQTAGSIL